MLLPSGVIIRHAAPQPYDPVKRHEDYLRTRKLKGRQPAQAKPSTGKLAKRSSSYTVRFKDGSTVTLSAKQLAEEQAYATKRVGEIKAKLGELRKELEKRLAKAHESDAKKKQGPTAADKSKAARDSKQYRQKHKQTLANKRKHAVKKSGGHSSGKDHSSVESIKKQIVTIHGALRVALERQRVLTSATKNG